MFTLVNGLPEVNEEFTNIRSIYEIIKKDPGKMVGGKRIKESARISLSYIYFYFHTTYDAYPDEKKKSVIKERLGVSQAWQPDELVLQAIEEIKEDTRSIETEFLENAKELVFDSLDYFKELRLQVRRKVNILRIKEEDLSPEELLARDSILENLGSSLGQLGKSVSEFQTMLNNLKTIEASKKLSAMTSKKGSRVVNELEENKDLYAVRPTKKMKPSVL